MKFDFLNNKDFLGGLLLAAIGVAAALVASDYPQGYPKRMGPGYLPSVLGEILFVFGVLLAVRGVLSGAKVKGPWAWKPVGLLTLAMLLFGFLVTRLGLIPALAAMFFASAAAGREFRFGEVLLLTAVMSALAVGVFVYLLEMPFRLFAGL